MLRLAPFAAAPLIIALAVTAASAGPAPTPTDPKAVQSGAYAVEPKHTRVQFAVSHMGFTDWYGDFSGVSGSLTLNAAKPALSQVDVTIPVGSIATTNATRDGELKSDQWLDAGRYPTVRFVSTKVVVTAPNRANITGNLTLHGVTRPVTLSARFNSAGVNPLDHAYTVGFNATGVIHRTDFGVKTYVPLIGDETTLIISAAFERTAR
jgi:polyisoprenoid-binding protein YceI